MASSTAPAAASTTNPRPSGRFAAEVNFLWHRLLGRDCRVTVDLLGQPVTLDIHARRELTRAFAIAKEAALLQHVLQHLQPGDVVYDIGANIGLIGLTLALHPAGRQCRIISFEPEPRNFAEMTRNIAANGLQERMTPECLALGREPGAGKLFVRGTAGEGRHSLVAAEGSTGAIEVRISTVSEFARVSGVAPDVMKIDVEGAEGQVLAGADELMRTSSKPRDVFLEIHSRGDRDRMPDGTTTIEAWLTGRGYTRAWSQQRRSGIHQHYRRQS